MPVIYNYTTPHTVDQGRYNTLIAREGWFATSTAKPLVDKDTADSSASTADAITSAERTKLQGIAANATANDTDANLKNTDNHTSGVNNRVFTAANQAKLAGLTKGYSGDTPERHGALEWNYDPIMAGSATGQATTTGTGYMLKITPLVGGLCTNVIMTVGTTAPAGALTSAQNFVELFDAAGNRVAVTADQTTAWATSGVKVMAWQTPVTLTAGVDYWLRVVSNSAAGTAAVFVRTNAGATTTPNFGFATPATYRFAVNGTGLTASTSTVTLASNSGSGAQPYWAALS